MDKKVHRGSILPIIIPSPSSVVLINMMHNVHNDLRLYFFRELLDRRRHHHRHHDEEEKEEIIVGPSHRLALYTFLLYVYVCVCVCVYVRVERWVELGE